MASSKPSKSSKFADARPCVGCGYCCKKATCVVAKAYGQKHGIAVMGLCPWLEYDESVPRYWCTLGVEDRSLEEPLTFGAGCCAPLFNSVREGYIKEQEKRKKAKHG